MTEKTWGIRLNRYSSSIRLSKDQLPAGCSNWLQPSEIDLWQRQGLIVWNDAEQRIAALSPAEALTLLNELETQAAWKSEGVNIRHYPDLR